jgi:hypothetical protein
MATIARVNSLPGTAPLLSPYEVHEPSLVHPSEDFTVRLTTISKSVLDAYGEKMQAGKWGNQYFCLMSHFGIGSNGGKLPAKAINYVEDIRQINSNILSVWGENIKHVRDYRDTGADGEAGRVYIGTSAFCQSIGNTPLEDIHQAYVAVSELVGRFAPELAPYTIAGSLALDGILLIVDKLTHNPSEVLKSQISLYPASLGALPHGDAYLQKGSYAFFFTDTNISDFAMTPSGEIVPSQRNGMKPPPYVVINIADGIVDAPSSEALTASVGLDIFEKYDHRFALPEKADNAAQGTALLNGLQKVGESYYLFSRLRRYEELNHKANKSAMEIKRMEALKEEIEKTFPSIKLGM